MNFWTYFSKNPKNVFEKIWKTFWKNLKNQEFLKISDFQSFGFYTRRRFRRQSVVKSIPIQVSNFPSFFRFFMILIIFRHFSDFWSFFGFFIIFQIFLHFSDFSSFFRFVFIFQILHHFSDCPHFSDFSSFFRFWWFFII